MGRLPGHSRGGHRLRHPRRHSGDLGRRLRLHRCAARRHRRSRFHRFLLRHHHRRARRGQDRLRQAHRGGVSVPHAVGLHHVCRNQGTGPNHGLPVSLHRNLRVRSGQRHARSRGQSARLDALPSQPHALPEHPPCELAGRPRARRSRGMDSRRWHARQLEDSTGPFPRADRALRNRFHGAAVPEVRSVRQGPHRRSDASGSGHPRGARRVFPRRPVLPGSTGQHPHILHRQYLLCLCYLELPRLGRGLDPGG